MLLLFYGGTFDPVHNGHLAIARAARDELGTTVRLMPAADPPHRAPPGASATQRARMLELAVAGEAGLVVDRRELGREGPSYTIDSLRELRRETGPAQPLGLLLGADSFIGLPSWREWQALCDFAHLVVAPRPGSPLDGALAPALAAQAAGRWADRAELLNGSPAGRIFVLDQPLQVESASDVRRQIAVGGPWQHWVPPAVAGFILAKQLYAGPGGEHSPV